MGTKCYNCIDCGIPIWTKGGRCRPCRWNYLRKNPEKHPSFIHGKKRNNKCLDCGKRISYGNIRCMQCHAIYRKINGLLAGVNNPMYKNGRPKCKQCGKQLVAYKSTYCKKCVWTVDEIRTRIIKSQQRALTISPNKKERLLLNILNIILPKKYKFVGNGKIVINGYIPDFIDMKNKKIIEMFGDYWHNKIEVKKRDKNKLATYKKYDYKTLVIWEKELKNPEMVLSKILEFEL